MSSNFMTADISFPTFTDQQSDGDKMEVITNYLFLLLENLRYTLENLEADNFNAAELDSIGKTITAPIYARIKDNAGHITQLAATAEGIATQVSDAQGRITSLQQTVNGFSISASNGSSSSTLYLTSNGITMASARITFSGMVTFTDLSTGGFTSINGANLMTGTVTADKIQGGSVTLLTAAGLVAGNLSITGAITADFSVELRSNGALRLRSSAGDVYIDAIEHGVQLQLNERGILTRGGPLLSNDKSDLGSASAPWGTVYAGTGESVTSDANRKHDIEPLPERYIAMLDRVEPKRFKLNDGTSGRYHAGFIAQEVETAMETAGVATAEFGGFVRAKDEEGKDIYMLRYEEFIPLLLAKIRQQEERISALEGRK